jgi:biotin carboxyl carrier protein
VLKEFPNNIYALSVNGKVFTVKVNHSEANAIEVLTTGFVYDFEVKTSTSALLEKFVKQSGSGKQKVNGIIAPMPGMVVKLNCAVGDEVSVNDKLIIVEAMKMENALSAPLTGKVTKINAEEGKPVDKGAVLIEIS